MSREIRVTRLLSLISIVGLFVPSGILSSTVFAQTLRDISIATAQGLQVSVKDNVTDVCLPRPVALKEVAELGLLRNGLQVVGEEDQSFHVLEIAVHGLEVKSIGGSPLGCAITLHVRMNGVVSAVVPYSYAFGSSVQKGKLDSALVEFLSYSTTIVGQKNGMQATIREDVAEVVDRFSLTILKTRDEVFKKHPEYRDRYLELRKFVDGLNVSRDENK